MVKSVKGPKEKLGEDKYEEVVKKDWKVAKLPTEEELAKEKHKSPKARSNINSRKNLVQYGERSEEVKEKNIGNLRFVEKEEDIDPLEVFGEKSNVLEIIEKVLPIQDALASRREQEVYYNYIKLILKDFDADELTATDIDDIVTLALNRVLEIRLMKAAKKSPKLVLEAMPTIEKLKKNSEKIKSGLASRRVDRIDVKNKPAFSIVDLASHLDEKNKLDFERRIEELEKQRRDHKPPKRDGRGLLIDDESS